MVVVHEVVCIIKRGAGATQKDNTYEGMEWE